MFEWSYKEKLHEFANSIELPGHSSKVHCSYVTVRGVKSCIAESITTYHQQSFYIPRSKINPRNHSWQLAPERQSPAATWVSRALDQVYPALKEFDESRLQTWMASICQLCHSLVSFPGKNLAVPTVFPNKQQWTQHGDFRQTFLVSCVLLPQSFPPFLRIGSQKYAWPTYRVDIG